MIALALVAGCGSAESARAGEEAAGAAPAETVAAAPVSIPSDAPTPVPSGDAPNALADIDPASLPAAPGATLCQAGEKRFFSCEIGAKRVSVCGDASGAVYRYGTPGKVELTSRSLSFANRGYSGGGETQLTARNGDYSYTVYDRTVRTSFGEGGNDPEFSSGLMIARRGRVISTRMCKGESPVEADAEHALPGGGFVEH